jgi:hypothetical protein
VTFMYLEGGNPPVAAGLFNVNKTVRGQQITNRIAWWPDGYKVTPNNMQLVVQEYRRTGLPVFRQRVIQLIEPRGSQKSHPKPLRNLPRVTKPP